MTTGTGIGILVIVLFIAFVGWFYFFKMKKPLGESKSSGSKPDGGSPTPTPPIITDPDGNSDPVQVDPVPPIKSFKEIFETPLPEETVVRAIITRTIENDKQTLGELAFYNSKHELLARAKTLELPWKNNENNVSRIPAGVYPCALRHSIKHGWHLHVQNVPGRSYILIHPGNYYYELRGCTLPGYNHTDINGDGLRDVTQSRRKLNELLKYVNPKGTFSVEYNNSFSAIT